MREPSEPLTMTTSPARIVAEHGRLQRRRGLGIAAPALAGSASQSARISGPQQRPDRRRRRRLVRARPRCSAGAPRPAPACRRERRSGGRAPTGWPGRAARKPRASKPGWHCSSRRSASELPPGSRTSMRAPRPFGGVAGRRAPARPSARSAPTSGTAASTASEFCTRWRPGAPSR